MGEQCVTGGLGLASLGPNKKEFTRRRGGAEIGMQGAGNLGEELCSKGCRVMILEQSRAPTHLISKSNRWMRTSVTEVASMGP